MFYYVNSSFDVNVVCLACFVTLKAQFQMSAVLNSLLDLILYVLILEVYLELVTVGIKSPDDSVDRKSVV